MIKLEQLHLIGKKQNRIQQPQITIIIPQLRNTSNTDNSIIQVCQRFHQKNETIKSLTLENSFPSNIIFKIKVNAVGFLSIEPSKGFIRSNSSSVKKQKFQVKVLFAYALIHNKNDQFAEEWQKIKQNSKLQHEFITVRRIQSYRGNEKMSGLSNLITNKNSQSSQKMKRSSVSPYKKSVQKKRNQKSAPKLYTQIQTNSKYNKDQNNKISQKVQDYSQQIYLQEEKSQQCPFYSTQQMQQIIEQLHSSSKLLQSEEIKNIKLSQQLSISEAKLKQITQDKMHIQIHKSIGIVCEDYHTTFTHLVILGLATFVFGFFLGKIQAEFV